MYNSNGCHPMKIELAVEVITYWPLYALCLRQRLGQSTNKQNRKSIITLLNFETVRKEPSLYRIGRTQLRYVMPKKAQRYRYR